MASSTEEHTVPESRNETQVRTDPRVRNDQERLRSIFRNMGASAPESWPSGASALASY